MVAPEGMLRWHFDEDERQAVRIGRAKLDQTPGLLDRALQDGNSGCAQLLLGFVRVPHLEPELRRRRGGLVLPIGELEESAPEKENDPARDPSAELPHGMEPEDITIEADASVVVPGVQHEATREDFHGRDA